MSMTDYEICKKEVLTMRYGYSFILEGPYDTGYGSVADALSAAQEEARNDIYWDAGDKGEVYIGVLAEHETNFDDFDIESLIEAWQESADYASDGAIGAEYLNLPEEKLEGLRYKLNNALREWAKDAHVDLSPTYITDVAAYNLRTGAFIRNE